jgi:hypothetical protein
MAARFATLRIATTNARPWKRHRGSTMGGRLRRHRFDSGRCYSEKGSGDNGSQRKGRHDFL